MDDPNSNAECLAPPKGLGPHDCGAVHPHRNGSWWFWIETWLDEYGPYPTQEAADAACIEYAKQL